MTERATQPRRPGPALVAWGSIALFAVLLALLAFQLGSGQQSAPQEVVNRKVIERRVITRVVPASGSAGATNGAPGVATTSGPTSVEAPVAPETSTAPAEPAPAPVTTGAS